MYIKRNGKTYWTPDATVELYEKVRGEKRQGAVFLETDEAVSELEDFVAEVWEMVNRLPCQKVVLDGGGLRHRDGCQICELRHRFMSEFPELMKGVG